MQMKSEHHKAFKRAAARATLAIMLTLGVVAPSVTSYSQLPAPPVPQSQTVMLVAAETTAPVAQAKVEVQFHRADAEELDALIKEYPALKDIKANLKQIDDDRLASLKEIKAENDFYPGGYEIGTYKDSVNGREFLMIHMYNTPNVCSAEGCPLTVYLKDGKDFRNVLETMSLGQISLFSTKEKMSLILPGSLSHEGGLTMDYDAKLGVFALVEPGAQQPSPAPAPAPK